MTTIKKKLSYTCDPGHGWLSVSLKDVQELGIERDISSCSYMTLTRAYLEEDSDAGIFLSAAKAKGWEVTTTSRPVETTPIRNYASYDPAKVALALSLKEESEVMLYNTQRKSWSTQGKIVGMEGSHVLIDCEHGHHYKTSKAALMKAIRPVGEAPELESTLPRMKM